MFLEQYKLESNPFAEKRVRPRYQSSANQVALDRLDNVLDQSLHCLFVSGRAGVGKSALVERRLKDLTAVTVSLIGPSQRTSEQFLRKVLRDVGLPAIDATPAELHNIVEVYLRHQSAKGTNVLLVADALERLSESALSELEWVMGLRYKNRPILNFVLLTRSEELVSELMPKDGYSPLAPFDHVRLSGFTLDETADYINVCLQSVGGQDEFTLFPDDVLRDVHAYTQGIVGDINGLCYEALNLLAIEVDETGKTSLNPALIARAGEKLNLRYDPAYWRDLEEALSPDAIHESDPGELTVEAAHLLVTSRGDVIAEIALNRPRMVLGRDQVCDISLDSSYVSRYQNLFMETESGWMLIDLNSTNGCFVNGRRVTQHELQDGDIIAVGHHRINFVGSRGRLTAARPESSRAGTDASTRDVDTLVSPEPIGKAESA
jgi:type II secretory pathway predicted ATPase ExeA